MKRMQPPKKSLPPSLDCPASIARRGLSGNRGTLADHSAAFLSQSANDLELALAVTTRRKGEALLTRIL